jgi:hypothetical protein
LEQQRDAQRLEPCRERAQMLLGEQFGRRDEHGLQTVAVRGEQTRCGDDGLATADVALHQPQHRPARGQVLRHLIEYAPLRAGGREWQYAEQRGDSIAGTADRR